MLMLSNIRKTCFLGLAFVIVLASALLTLSQAQAVTLDAKAIGKVTGTEATVEEDGVIRIGWSREDVPVTVDGVRLPPAAGLGSWAAFKAVDEEVMIMGDTVVFEDEITPAMDAAFAHGLEVTALHNHFVFDRPPVYFMHIGGHGNDATNLAKGVRAMWDAIKEVREQTPRPADRFGGRVPEKGQINIASLQEILGAEPEVNSGVPKFSFEREATMHGAPVGASMGISTWATFTSDAKYAAVDGDFAMTAEEVQPVMHALRDANIHIVALHNHMIGGEPFYYFLHYWGRGNPEMLARGVRSALDVQK